MKTNLRPQNQPRSLAIDKKENLTNNQISEVDVVEEAALPEVEHTEVGTIPMLVMASEEEEV